MPSKRSFLRSTQGREDFAELSWTRRAIEVAEGARGTPGSSRDQIFKSEAEVEQAIRLEVARLLAAGFTEHSGDAVRVAPEEHVARLVEQHHLRTCAVPVFGKGPSAPNGSRRGGVPFLAKDEPWPLCGACGQPLRFVMQAALAELREVTPPLPSEGLLQLFACDSDCYSENGWEAFSRTNLVRVISSTDGVLAAESEDFAGDFVLPEERIASWTLHRDAPDPEALAALAKTDSDTAYDAWELLEERGLGGRREKVGGWPSWVQEAPTVTCRQCRAEMTYALQLEETLEELEVLRGNALYVVTCARCASFTSVQQR